MFKLLHLKLRCLFAINFVVPCNSRLSEKHFQLGSGVLNLVEQSGSFSVAMFFIAYI